MLRSLTAICAIVLLLAACAGWPVQEMSDARQAIQAAKEAGARDHAPTRLTDAEHLLDEAERDLEMGHFDKARAKANAAKGAAIEARDKALEDRK